MGLVNTYYKESPDKDYFKIENLKNLSTNFKSLFVDDGIYRKKDVTDKITAKKVLSKKDLIILAPHPEPGQHIRMYVQNSKGQIKAFPLGFTLQGKITFTPEWRITQGQIVLNKNKTVDEYDNLASLIEAQKKYLIFRLERDHPDDLRERPGDFLPQKEFNRELELIDKTRNLSEKELIQQIKAICNNLPEYDLDCKPAKSLEPDPNPAESQENCCVI